MYVGMYVCMYLAMYMHTSTRIYIYTYVQHIHPLGAGLVVLQCLNSLGIPLLSSHVTGAPEVPVTTSGGYSVCLRALRSSSSHEILCGEEPENTRLLSPASRRR